MKNTLRSRWKDSLRIIWAIAAKDIVDAIKNKTTISIILGIGILMLSGQALPLLLKLKSTPTAVVYDAGESGLIDEMAMKKEFALHEVPSQQMLEKVVAEANETLLGLVLPADLRQRLQVEGRVDLEGFVAHWAKPSDVTKLVEFFERQLGDLIGVPVHIDHESNLVFPDPESDGRQSMISLSLAVAVITIGIFLVPYLMLEEKESHTMEALLVSPASHGQMVLGKSIAGLFYCLSAAAVVFAMNFSMVTQWWIAFLAIICGSLFSVAIGLLLGTLFENPGSVNLWGGVILIILIAPVSFELTAVSGWPPILQTLTPWLPSVAFSNAIRTSFSNITPLNLLVPSLGVMLVATALLLIGVVWKVRRMGN